MLKYLKFTLAPLTLIISIYVASLGGNYIWFFFSRVYYTYYDW